MIEEYIITWLLRGLPEAIIYMYVVHKFTNAQCHKQKFWISIVAISTLMVIIRSLPMSYGIHTIVLAMCILFFSVIVCNINGIEATTIILKSLMVEFLCEGYNIVLLKYVFDVKMDSIMTNPLLKNLYGTPSLVLMFMILYLVGKIKKGTREVNG